MQKFQTFIYAPKICEISLVYHDIEIQTQLVMQHVFNYSAKTAAN